MTTHDELYQSNFAKARFTSASAKEVYRYAEALKGLITTNMVIEIQKIIEENEAGIRKLPGTELRNELTGAVVYTPPQNYTTVIELMNNLEKFMN